MTKKELIKYIESEIVRFSDIRNDKMLESFSEEKDIMYFEGLIDGYQTTLTELKKLSFKNKDKQND